MARSQQTFLGLVNAVLRRLGKPQTNSTDFAGLSIDSWGGIVKIEVNQALQAVFSEHDWSTLTATASFSSSVRTYNLSTSFSTFGR